MARFSSLALLAAAIALANNGAWAASVQGLSPRAAASIQVQGPNGQNYTFSADPSTGASITGDGIDFDDADDLNDNDADDRFDDLMDSDHHASNATHKFFSDDDDADDIMDDDHHPALAAAIAAHMQAAKNKTAPTPRAAASIQVQGPNGQNYTFSADPSVGASITGDGIDFDADDLTDNVADDKFDDVLDDDHHHATNATHKFFDAEDSNDSDADVKFDDTMDDDHHPVLAAAIAAHMNNKTATPTATHAASSTPTMTPTAESETIHSDANMNVGTFNTKPGQSVTFD